MTNSKVQCGLPEKLIWFSGLMADKRPLSAVIKTLNDQIVKRIFKLPFLQSSPLSPPCAPLCELPDKRKVTANPCHSHTCVKAVWPVCGNSKIQPNAAATVWGARMAQWGYFQFQRVKRSRDIMPRIAPVSSNRSCGQMILKF